MTPDPDKLGSDAPRRYLICPSFPTPNGRLHLGHVAGPYLAADLLKRHLQRLGHDVCLLGGFDTFEHHVEFKAWHHGTPPDSVAQQHHDLILRSLKLFHIDYDDWIVPSDEKSNAGITCAIRELLDRLASDARIELRRESMLYSPADERFVIGPWLSGRCPACQQAVAGFTCEACGHHFQPGQMLEPRARVPLGPLESREVLTPFLRGLNDYRRFLDRKLDDRRMSATCQSVLATYANRPDVAVRLGVPGAYGIPLPMSLGCPDQVCFTYSMLFPYCLYLGSRSLLIKGWDRNPFSQDSGITTITTLGTDSIVHRGFTLPALAHFFGGSKDFDWIIALHFYTLNGEKFSTSRNHAIWADEFLERAGVPADAARLYLCITSPAQRSTNFSLAEFERFCDRTYAPMLIVLRDLLAAVPSQSPEPSRPGELARLRSWIREQDQLMKPEQFAPDGFAALGLQWLDQWHPSGDPAPGAYWILKGFCLLMYPVMPVICQNLWEALGHSGRPRISEYQSTPLPRPVTLQPSMPRIRLVELALPVDRGA